MVIRGCVKIDNGNRATAGILRDSTRCRNVTLVITIIQIIVTIYIALAAANVIEFSIQGSGSFMGIHGSSHASEIAAASADSFMYNYRINWGEGYTTVESDFLINGADGGYGNQYRVVASGAGHKIRYDAYRIAGNFTGSRDFTIEIRPGENESVDQLVLMDGNMTLTAQIRSVDKYGRPVDNETIYLIGEAIVRSYVNLSSTYPRPDDWLGLCGKIADQWGL